MSIYIYISWLSRVQALHPGRPSTGATGNYCRDTGVALKYFIQLAGLVRAHSKLRERLGPGSCSWLH